MVRRLIAAGVLLIASSAAADDGRVMRLQTLARVWAAVKYSHPAMLTREIDWDGALLRALPQVNGDLPAAVDAMLREIGDPVTRVATAPATPHDLPLTRLDGDVLIVNAGPYVAANAPMSLYTKARGLGAEIAKAKAVVVDLTAGDAAEIEESLAPRGVWSTTQTTEPPQWTPLHSGYASPTGPGGGYYSALTLIPGMPLRIAKNAPQRIALVADGRAPLPGFAVALWQAGKAALVSSAPLSDAANTTKIDLGGGASAVIRTADYAVTGLTADIVSATPLDDAINFVRGTTPLSPHPSAPRAIPAVHILADSAYPELLAPDLPHRLLAAFRIWSVIHYFYPYRRLIGDWDAVLREFIPRFEQANDGDAYAAAVLEMTAHIADGHTFVTGHPGVDKLIGDWWLPLGLRLIEGQPLVVDTYGNAGVSAGDVVVSIDGEPIETRMARMYKLLPGSTESARRHGALRSTVWGPAKSVAVVELRDAGGATRTVRIPRVQTPRPPDGRGAYRMLAGNIGYVDLRVLTPEQVDPMFDVLMNTKAIIFDMRGYPRQTAWPIAPRLNTRHALYGAIFIRRQLSGASSREEQETSYRFEQALPTSTRPVYGGKVLMLIDDRAMSQAEHTCLFFEAATHVTFVGAPTAGTNGDVTSFVLPGGITVYFTGQEVRHADGRQLQRIGIQPDIRVEPTIAGIRAGKDEVLDRAIAFINGQ